MITEVLSAIQNELKAPKNQYNSFGKYNFRNCEDILEALKPILAKHKAINLLSDEVVLIGDRFYIKATATLQIGDEKISVTAFAREEDSKKGMDSSQLTGSTSSYARKYALNGLYAIDDTKDADTPPNENSDNKAGKKEPSAPPKKEPQQNHKDIEKDRLTREINELVTKMTQSTGTKGSYIKKTALTATNCDGTTTEDLRKIKNYIEKWAKDIENGGHQ